MKRRLIITLLIALTLAATWVATAFHGPRLLERELRTVAEREFFEIEREVRRQYPDTPRVISVWGVALPIVKVELRSAPAPFVFKAQRLRLWLQKSVAEPATTGNVGKRPVLFDRAGDPASLTRSV